MVLVMRNEQGGFNFNTPERTDLSVAQLTTSMNLMKKIAFIHNLLKIKAPRMSYLICPAILDRNQISKY